MKTQFKPECPECGSRLKQLPSTRRGKAHVYCQECGHDFGRYENLVENYQQVLVELESQLGIAATPR